MSFLSQQQTNSILKRSIRSHQRVNNLLDTTSLFVYNSASSIAVGDVVRVSSPGTVGLADKSSSATVPAIGVVVDKPFDSVATVAQGGAVDVFTGLGAGDVYYLGLAGAITPIPPGPTEEVQIIGVGVDSRILMLNIQTGAVGSGPTPPSLPVFDCDASLSPGDVVYLASSNYVDLADYTDPNKTPAIGVVATKPTTTTAEVASTDTITAFSGLVPGAMYYLGPLGTIMTPATSNPTYIVQRIGVAATATTLMLTMNQEVLL